jgi:hypothetical protein
MGHKKTITILVILITIFSTVVSFTGIFSNTGDGSFEYQSIRGETIEIYGKGVYKHMSSDVAIQGIAQDYVTLFFAIPLLIISLFLYRNNSLRGKFMLSGTLLYFFLTYLFYTAMAMFNYLYLIYVILLSCSLFALLLSIISFDVERVKSMIRSERVTTFTGWFLLFNALMIALLWLSSIVTPLISGELYPQGLNHYTTMIVQGFDLGIFLPLGVVSAILAIKREIWGVIFSTIYVIFLSILMCALTSKIIFMANAGANVIPVIFMMPSICLISIILSVLLMKNIRLESTQLS